MLRNLFPTPLPPNTHPVLFFTGIQFDIRMSVLEIDSLGSGNIRVPCVDRLRDGRTQFQYPITDYVTGTNGMDLMSYVPAFVGSLGNVPIHTGKVRSDVATRLLYF